MSSIALRTVQNNDLAHRKWTDRVITVIFAIFANNQTDESQTRPNCAWEDALSFLFLHYSKVGSRLRWELTGNCVVDMSQDSSWDWNEG